MRYFNNNKSWCLGDVLMVLPSGTHLFIYVLFSPKGHRGHYTGHLFLLICFLISKLYVLHLELLG